MEPDTRTNGRHQGPAAAEQNESSESRSAIAAASRLLELKWFRVRSKVAKLRTTVAVLVLLAVLMIGIGFASAFALVNGLVAAATALTGSGWAGSIAGGLLGVGAVAGAVGIHSALSRRKRIQSLRERLADGGGTDTRNGEEK